MKKIFILGLVVLLALAFGSAYAQANAGGPVLDFKASGAFSLDYNWGRNYNSVQHSYSCFKEQFIVLYSSAWQVNVQCQYGEGVKWNHLF